MFALTVPHVLGAIGIDFIIGLVIGLLCLLEGLGSGDTLEMTTYIRAYSDFVEEAIKFDKLDFGSKSIIFLVFIMTLFPVFVSYWAFAVTRTLYTIFLKTPCNIMGAIWKALD